MSEERAHALLSASSAKRWMSCTPSARFEEQFPDSSSSYADEGTAAHDLANWILSPAEVNLNLPNPRESKHYNQEMEEAVNLYVDLVLEKFSEARRRSKDAVLLIEQRLDYSAWAPEGFGTGDAIIIADGILEVIDLKYGKGVPVHAEENHQLRLYGLGAYHTYDCLYDLDLIRMTIVQPRLDHITTEELTAWNLVDWADREVTFKAKLAWEGQGEWVPGDHCRFCRGKAVCAARADANMTLITRYEYSKANTLGPHDISGILGCLDELISWAGDVKGYALEQAEQQGVRWPGWKLVEGRSNRKYADQAQTIETLRAAGYEEPLLYKPREILGLTEMEKLVGKKRLPELLGDLIIKPAGKPVLVPDTDKRPELQSQSSAAADFAEEVDD